jgi:hypothetical protein
VQRLKGENTLPAEQGHCAFQTEPEGGIQAKYLRSVEDWPQQLKSALPQNQILNHILENAYQRG